MNILERYFAPASGALREFVGINVFFEPADFRLYEKLLPKPFSMPRQPLVNVAVVDYLKAAPWPLTRWQEWGVLLKCAWHGDPGWYPVTMPVTKWLPMSAGRYLGYPKYVVDRIRLARDGDGWMAEAAHRGVRQVAMQFEPGIIGQLPSWAEELASTQAFFKGDVYLLVPPGAGAGAQRVSFAYVDAHWASRSGTVRLEIDRREQWAGLVPGVGPFTGEFSHFVGGCNLVAERLAGVDNA
jgi:Acetoacetate decarboxylase (ADC)